MQDECSKMNVYILILTSIHVEYIAMTGVVCVDAYFYLLIPFPTKVSHAI